MHVPHATELWPRANIVTGYPAKEELKILSNIINQAGNSLREEQAKLHSFLYSDLGAQLPLHISLSRPVILRTEERQSFMEAFEASLKNSDISP